MCQPLDRVYKNPILNLSTLRTCTRATIFFRFSQSCHKWTYVKLTYFSSAIFEPVEYLDAGEHLNSNMQHDRPWMQIHMMDVNHQRQVWVDYFFPDIRLATYKTRFQTHKHITYGSWTWWSPHNIIQILNIVMSDWRYYAWYSPHLVYHILCHIYIYCVIGHYITTTCSFKG